VLTAYVAVTMVAALANFGAATLDASRSRWVLANMTRLGVPTPSCGCYPAGFLLLAAGSLVLGLASA